MNQHISIVLCETSHPGNIGGAARAMKNMALSRLCLVAPRRFPDNDAYHRASGAEDVLDSARIVSNLPQALSDCQWVFGMSARARSFQWPTLTPHQAAQKIVHDSKTQKVAIVFGSEQAGLSNEQLQLCDFHITIPTNPDFSSLNLSAAVQVMAYEIYQAIEIEELPDKATVYQIVGLIEHFMEMAEALDFFNPLNPKKLLPRIKRLLARAQLESEEVNILRGFLKCVQQKVDR